MSYRHLVSADTRTLAPGEPFELENGNILTNVEIAYRTWGHLNRDADNAVLVCHALTGSADVDEWWSGVVGHGRALDPEHDFVVAANVLGGCYGTTGPGGPDHRDGSGRGKEPPYPEGLGPDFPEVTIRDQVRLQALLLSALGVRGVHLVAGGSMGGMQALEWAVMEPLPLERAVVVAAPAQHSPWAVGLGEIQRQAIRGDPAWKEGRYARGAQPAHGLAMARMAAMCSYRSPESFRQKFGRDRTNAGHRAAGGDFQVESYLRHQGNKLVRRFDANSYLTLSQAMDSHDISRARGSLEQVLAQIRPEVLVLGIPSDVLYTPREIRELAAGIPRGELAWIDSNDGHDAFLIEQAQVNQALRRFRETGATRAELTGVPSGESQGSNPGRRQAAPAAEGRAERCA